MCVRVCGVKGVCSSGHMWAHGTTMEGCICACKHVGACDRTTLKMQSAIAVKTR